MLSATVGPLVEHHDVLLVDLDGVVYVGESAVKHAVPVLTEVVTGGVRVGYVTNNARRTPQDVAAHLSGFGLAVQSTDVVTSAQAGARLVAEVVAAGERVLAIGGPGVAEALRERGFVPVRTAAEEPAAVMQGFGPDVSWRDLAEGAYALATGVPFIATNLDRTIPTTQGRAPGNGTLVGVLTMATGVVPRVAGKPESPLMLESIDRLGAKNPLVIGDRLDTDIEAGVRLHIPTLLVLTGVSGVPELLAAAPHERPQYISLDLRGLLEQHPHVVVDGQAVNCRQARVHIEDRTLHVDQQGDDWVDLLRAAASACWTAADVGYALEVDQVVKAMSDS